MSAISGTARAELGAPPRAGRTGDGPRARAARRPTRAPTEWCWSDEVLKSVWVFCPSQFMPGFFCLEKYFIS